MRILVKKILEILIVLYVLLCIVTSFSYNKIISIIGNNEIIYTSSQGIKYMVFLDKETVNFVEIEDLYIDIFGLSKIPLVAEKIIYNLEEPQNSTRIYKRKKYFLYDENNMLSNGIVLKGYKLSSPYGIIESTNVYFGVSKDELENELGVIQMEKHYSEVLNEDYYIFMFESEESIKIDELYNSSF